MSYRRRATLIFGSRASLARWSRFRIPRSWWPKACESGHPWRVGRRSRDNPGGTRIRGLSARSPPRYAPTAWGDLPRFPLLLFFESESCPATRRWRRYCRSRKSIERLLGRSQRLPPSDSPDDARPGKPSVLRVTRRSIGDKVTTTHHGIFYSLTEELAVRGGRLRTPQMVVAVRTRGIPLPCCNEVRFIRVSGSRAHRLALCSRASETSWMQGHHMNEF